jgi:hypothetical protein
VLLLLLLLLLLLQACPTLVAITSTSHVSRLVRSLALAGQDMVNKDVQEQLLALQTEVQPQPVQAAAAAAAAVRLLLPVVDAS